MIKNIQKVTGFLGPTGNPSPVSEKEIDKIMGRIREGTLVPKPSITFDIGEQVKVCEGPFASFSGLVEEVDEEKSRLKVSVSIFGLITFVFVKNYIRNKIDFLVKKEKDKNLK